MHQGPSTNTAPEQRPRVRVQKVGTVLAAPDPTRATGVDLADRLGEYS